MGAPKALLDAAGEPFVRRLARVFADAGCSPILVVYAPALLDALGAALAGTDARLVPNPADRSEPIDSLRLALAALPTAVEAALVTPVDVPGFSAGTVRHLIDAYRASPAPIVQPRHAGRGGHPILLARAIWPALFHPVLPDGLRTVIARHAGSTLRVEVDEPGVLTDMDTPADYLDFTSQER